MQISPGLAVELRGWLANRPADAVLFPRPSACNVVRMLRRDMQDAGVTEINEYGQKRVFHSFRHTAGTLASEHHGIEAASAFLGHSSTATTKRYNHSGRKIGAKIACLLPVMPLNRAAIVREFESF